MVVAQLVAFARATPEPDTYNELAALINQYGGGRFSELSHVTASALILHKNRVLLHEHRKTALWLASGGHLEGNELPWEAALRETREETGLLVDVLSRPALFHGLSKHSVGDHTHFDLSYLAQPAERSPPTSPSPGESRNLKWVGYDEARKMAPANVTEQLHALVGRLLQ